MPAGSGKTCTCHISASALKRYLHIVLAVVTQEALDVSILYYYYY